MIRFVRFGLILSAVITIGVMVRAQQPAEKSLAAMKTAPGLEVKLWAAEPMLANPTDLTVDERGRVWVVEGVNYRRTQRNLPDLRPAGDRIVILEDTDLDGHADKVKVFDQNPQIRVPLGIAVLGNKVYVSQAPDLIVYTKDADDKILKKEVLLTGFGGIDHDHGLHAVVFGPDGKLYFNQGNTGLDVTDKSRTRIFTQGTGANVRPGNGYYEGVAMRVNADGTGFEVIGQNFRNPYEIALDSFGNVFQTDNDDDGNAWTRLLYNMEGGNYGFRGPMNKSWLEDRGTHWHIELPGVVPVVLRLGAGSPCGLMVYEGTLLPAAYRGLLHADAGKRIVAAYPLTADGAGYSATIQELLNGGTDTWSRPTDVAAAPDGAVFVSDWYDPGVGGHQMGDPDGSRGRIYRLAPVGNKPVAAKIDLSTPAGLTAALDSPNQSAQYAAHMAIAAQGQNAVPMLQQMWHQSDTVLKARALWLLGGLGAPGTAAVEEALHERDPRFRVLGLRVAKLNGANMVTIVKPLLHDESPQVRREILLSIRDTNPALMLPPYTYKDQVQPTADWLDAMTQLVSQYDGKDRWYLEAVGIAARGREEALYARLKSGDKGEAFNRVVWELRPRTALPDLIATVNNGSAPMADRTSALETLGAMQWPEAARALESFMLAPGSPAALTDQAFMLYTHQLFSMWTDSRTSPALPQIMRRAFGTPSTQSEAAAVAEALEDPTYIPDLLGLAKADSASPESRAAALDAVAAKRDANYIPDFQSLAQQGPARVRVSAVRALTMLGKPGMESWAQSLITSDAPNEVRAEALRLLGATAPGLNTILDLAEQGKIPSEFQTLARNLTNYATPPAPPRPRAAGQSPVAMRVSRETMPTDPAYVAIRTRAAKVLPLPAARRVPTAFELEQSYAGHADNGHKIFESDGGCAACHSLGGKKKLGPDLSAIGAKYGRQAMLDNIVSPSDAIGHEYVPTTLVLKSGDRVSGLISEESADRIVVQTGPETSQSVKPSDVASRQEIRVSLMPEGLLNNLTAQQIADLLEFLSTLK